MLLSNKANLKELLGSLPELPGIYKMLDKNGNIIYIGKSKCLKKRVKSYFSKTPVWEKVKKMVKLIESIEYVVTDTHLEARLLECELIKYYKPYFNFQMKNDQKYVYLKVSDYNTHNGLAVVHERENACYGPFRSRSTLNDIVTSMKNIYPITKKDGHYTFLYHLLPAPMNRDEFNVNRQCLLELFDNTEGFLDLITLIQEKMAEAVSDFRFETASRYRDLLPCLTYLKNGMDGYRTLLTKDIVLKLPTPKGLKLFYITKGNIVHKRLYKAPNKNTLNNFIQKGIAMAEKFKSEYKLKEIGFLSQDSCLPITEKNMIDFRDILFSELLSLPEDMVLYL